MIPNENSYRIFRPDLENPTVEDCYEPFRGQNLMPIPWVEPVDVANGVLFLASDKARFVTGVTLPTDGRQRDAVIVPPHRGGPGSLQYAGGPGRSVFGQLEAGHDSVELTQVTPVALL